MAPSTAFSPDRPAWARNEFAISKIMKTTPNCFLSDSGNRCKEYVSCDWAR